MLITYCYFKTEEATTISKGAFIEDISRYKIASQVELEAIKIYNLMFRTIDDTGIIVHHSDENLNGSTVRIQCFDIRHGGFLVYLIHNPDKRSCVDPGYLMSLDQFRKNSASRGKIRRKVTPVEIKSSDNSYSFDFDPGCFLQFKRFFDVSKTIQPDQTYEAFLLMTHSIRNKQNRNDDDQVNEKETFRKAMAAVGYQDMVDFLYREERYGKIFEFPFKYPEKMLHNAARGLSVIDRSVSAGFDALSFQAGISDSPKYFVDASSLTSLLPQRKLNDEIMNVISTW